MVLLHYEFVRHALYAGTIVALLAGIIGYFVVLRRAGFAGHALGHISFAGAAGAGLIGLQPFLGQLLLTVLSALGMGLLGERMYKSDLAIGIVLAFALGCGVLFLHLYTAYAATAMTVLFGNLLAVSSETLCSMLLYSLLALLALAFIARPLLFCSLEPELAQAKGISLRFISTVFMIILAISVTEVSQVVGVLLVFTLLVAPAAAALNCTRTVYSGLIVTVLFAFTIVWFGIFLAFITDWPIPFWISCLSLLSYLGSLLGKRLMQ